MAKVALSFGCAKQSKNLEWYLIYNEQTIPLTCDDTDNKVMTPRVTLAGTQSTSIQKDTQEMATIRIEGK